MANVPSAVTQLEHDVTAAFQFGHRPSGRCDASDGVVQGFVVTLTDVTERERLITAKEAPFTSPCAYRGPRNRLPSRDLRRIFQPCPQRCCGFC